MKQLKFFSRVQDVLDYVITELVCTLKDDLSGMEREAEGRRRYLVGERRDMKRRIADIETVSSLVLEAENLLNTLKLIAGSNSFNGGTSVKELQQIASAAIVGSGLVGRDPRGIGNWPQGLTQVVIFASEGLTRSVAIRRLPPGGVACVVIDYDDRHRPDGSVPVVDFEYEHLGVSREEFDKTATYVW